MQDYNQPPELRTAKPGAGVTDHDQAKERPAPALTKEQREILEHTLYRAARGYYCGDSVAMQELVVAGLMQSAGRPAWCPDDYFTITPAGRAAIKPDPITQRQAEDEAGDRLGEERYGLS